MLLVVFSSHAPFADTNTSPRRHQVSSGAHHGLLVSSMMWVDRMLFFFSFCNSQPGRVLPNYIYNERDPSISNFGDRMIDWFNWNEYFPGFICRCAEKAKLAGYDLIGAQFFGKKQNVTKCIPQLCTIVHMQIPNWCWSHRNSFKILFSEGTSSFNWIYRPRVQSYEWKISVSGQHSRCYPLT